ncbi:MAG: fumarate hydratase, partial [Polaromonas sp.]
MPITQEDLVHSIADALQYISHYHPPDFVQALRRAHAAETHPPAKAAMEQLLINSRLSALGHRPLCQDTGVVQVFVRLGMEVQWQRRDGEPLRSLQALVNEAVRQAYTHPANSLRASMVRDP